MMDYMSNFPPPHKEQATKEIYFKIIVIDRYKTINREMISAITTEYMQELPIGKMGSFTGWYVFGVKESVNAVCKILDNKIENAKHIIKKLVNRNLILKSHHHLP